MKFRINTCNFFEKSENKLNKQMSVKPQSEKQILFTFQLNYGSKLHNTKVTKKSY